MRRILFILLMLAASLRLAAQEQPDSTYRYSGLDDLLSQFYVTLERADMGDKCREMDGLIETCKDSLTRQHVTMSILDHYQHSRVMGEEAVAIYVYDKWVASGKVKARGDFEQLILDQFVLFNRDNLIGMTARPVELFKPCRGTKTVPVPGKVNVLFFFDTMCSKCRLETQLLPSVLNEVDFPLEFVAVYVGDDKRQWRDYRRNFKIRNRKVRVTHLWDPAVESDYQKAYAVLATPRMYVVWKDGEIIGRRLEVENLKEVLHYISIANAEKENQDKD